MPTVLPLHVQTKQCIQQRTGQSQFPNKSPLGPGWEEHSGEDERKETQQKPTTPAQSNLPSISPTKINKPSFFIINTSRYESPGVTVSSPLFLQTHTTHTQQRTKQARSAYSEPQGLKFCLWETWELSWERDMATGSFSSNWKNVTGSSPAALSNMDSWPPVWSSPRLCQNRWYLWLQKHSEGIRHPLKPSPVVWGPNCCVCDLCCINCRSLFIRNSIWYTLTFEEYQMYIHASKSRIQHSVFMATSIISHSTEHDNK